MRMLMVVGLVVLVVMVGGLTVVASMDMKPSVQKVEQQIPDEHFPR